MFENLIENTTTTTTKIIYQIQRCKKTFSLNELAIESKICQFK